MFKVEWFAELNGWSVAKDERKNLQPDSGWLESFNFTIH